MKPEQSEQFFIEELFNQSIDAAKVGRDILKEIDKLTGDASTRRYYRLKTDSNSYVVCLDNPTLDGSSNRFLDVQDYLQKNKIRVPKVYDNNLSRGYILEEDLGDKTLLSHLANIEDSQAELQSYKEAIDILVDIQKVQVDSKLIPDKFDFDKLYDEMVFQISIF